MPRTLGKVQRDWRKFLTPDERKIIQKSDTMMQRMDTLRTEYESQFARDRQLIVNRAIQRAKHAAREKLGMSEVGK